MSFKPTQEQVAILEAAKTNKMLKIEAFAGSGKSSTLALLANQNPNRSLYIAFNKTVADEAKTKFPSHVDCRTIHSMAYSVFGRQLHHKLSRSRGEGYVNVAGTPSEIAKFYSIPDINKRGFVLKARVIATLVKETVTRFQNSDDYEIHKHHVPKKTLSKTLEDNPEVNKDDLIVQVLYYADRLWKDRINVDSVVLAEHDTYLKMWHLSNPQLDYDTIYLDESQDSNAVTLDILAQQTCNKVFVGDDYQACYGWRGAVNAMKLIEAETLYLTKSFRFGQDIADFANYVINPEFPVVGFEKVDTKIGQVTSKKYTHIFRTNGGLLDEAINLTANGISCKADIDTRKFESMLRSAIALRNNDHKNVKDELITMYNQWSDLVEEAEDSPELKRIVLIINSGKQWLYLNTIAKMRRIPKEYDVLLITGHKSKGLEWDNVIIADDFATDMVMKGDVGDGKYDQQEVNLFYVACTRAMKTLQIPVEVYQAYKFNDVDYGTEEEYDMMNNIPVSVGNMVCLGAGTSYNDIGVKQALDNFGRIESVEIEASLDPDLCGIW